MKEEEESMVKGSEMTEMSGIEIEVDGHKYKATRLCAYGKEEFGVYVDFQRDFPIGGLMGTWVIIPARSYTKEEFVGLVTQATREEIEKERKKHQDEREKHLERGKSEFFANVVAEKLGIKGG